MESFIAIDDEEYTLRTPSRQENRVSEVEAR